MELATPGVSISESEVMRCLSGERISILRAVRQNKSVAFSAGGLFTSKK